MSMLGAGCRSISADADAVGHLSSHAAGIATSAVQLGVLISAAINGGVVLQPTLSGPDDFVPHERWRLPAGTRFDGLAEGFVGAGNEGSATTAFDPDVAVDGSGDVARRSPLAREASRRAPPRRARRSRGVTADGAAAVRGRPGLEL